MSSMTKRTKRGFMTNKKQTLINLKTGRDAAVKVRTEAKISSPDYRLAGETIVQIDLLAKELTGDPMYFHIKGHA